MTLSDAERRAARKMNRAKFSYGAYMEFMQRDVPVCSVCRKFMYARFVVPGETRWQCQKCGKCCTGMGGKINVRSVPGLDFTEDGACTQYSPDSGECLIQDEKPAGCKMWPFHGAMDTDMSPTIFLVVNTACSGYGKGPVITDEIYDRLVDCVKTGRQIQDAFGEDF